MVSYNARFTLCFMLPVEGFAVWAVRVYFSALPWIKVSSHYVRENNLFFFLLLWSMWFKARCSHLHLIWSCRIKNNVKNQIIDCLCLFGVYEPSDTCRICVVSACKIGTTTWLVRAAVMTCYGLYTKSHAVWSLFNTWWICSVPLLFGCYKQDWIWYPLPWASGHPVTIQWHSSVPGTYTPVYTGMPLEKNSW